MSSLADLPELIGFFSYSREDDDAFKGTLSALRDAIQRELSAQLGRSKKTFRLFQDQESIAPGQFWASEIKNAVEQAVFFIPIVTPRMVNSQNCHFEFDAFVAREGELGRSNLVFPILYISVPALDNEAQWRNHPVLSFVAKRQWVDWRPFRHQEVQTTAVREAVERFCGKIVEALHEPWVSPEERQRQLEAEAQERADVQLGQEEAEAKQRAEEERAKRLQAAEAQRVAEERRLLEESQAMRREEDVNRKEAEAAVAHRIEQERRSRNAETNERAELGLPDVKKSPSLQLSRRAVLIGSGAIGAAVLIVVGIILHFSENPPAVFLPGNGPSGKWLVEWRNTMTNVATLEYGSNGISGTYMSNSDEPCSVKGSIESHNRSVFLQINCAYWKTTMQGTLSTDGRTIEGRSPDASFLMSRQ
jgi:hypothetical protein